ncbi:MAG: folate-binding protein [Betaproteobacteria bacterium]|jgi:folate-binding protein YgfZ
MAETIDWSHIVSLDAASGAHLGHPQREFDAVSMGAALMPVSRFELLRVHGSDAHAFLQGQLTCDLDQVTIGQAQFGGFCTPKGRLLANFLLMSVPQAYLMYLPADVATSVTERLRKFILRSDVKIERESTVRALALAGPAAPATLLQAFGKSPEPGMLTVAQHAYASVVRLSGETFLIVAAVAAMGDLWAQLSKHAIPAGVQCWDWTLIRAGLPWITAATQDQFLPQMIGLDAIGGVSFSKGCYTGQEIVARARYRGEVKRKLHFGRTRGACRTGDALLAAGNTCGTVLDAAPDADGGWILLAVINEQTEAQIHLAGGEAVITSAAASAIPA